MMSDSDRGPLADVVESYMLDRGMRPHQIHENGGPHPATLWLIRTGTTRHPKTYTLDNLARALATHPHSKRLDTGAMTQMRHGLYAAAGYDAVGSLSTEDTLELGLNDLFADVTLAQVWLRFLREQQRLDLSRVMAGMVAFRAATERYRSGR